MSHFVLGLCEYGVFGVPVFRHEINVPYASFRLCDVNVLLNLSCPILKSISGKDFFRIVLILQLCGLTGTLVFFFHARQVPEITENKSTDMGDDFDDVIDGVRKVVPTEGLSDAFVTSLSIILVSEVRIPSKPRVLGIWMVYANLRIVATRLHFHTWY